MAVDLGAAMISVGLSTGGLAGDIKKAFSGAGDVGGDAGKSAGKGFGLGFAGVAVAAVGALGIGFFFKGAVSGAADLEQSMGAVSSVFGSSAGQMHEWAQSAATGVGLSANEFNELGTLIGSQLKNGGTAMDELAPKTKTLISTGADLASMFDGTTSEAVEALSSALKGERDPIERYGVSLNQAKIDAEAAALGFEKVGGSLSAEANQAATLSLIMKQTADAHGNFGRETDTLAHKQQVLNAQLANCKARIGTELLPVVAALTGALSSALGPAINGTVTVIQEVVGGFRAFGAAFKAADGDITSSGFAGVLEAIGGAAGMLWAGLSMGSGVRAEFAGQLTGLVAVGANVRAAFDAIGPVVTGLFAAFAPLIPQVLSLATALSPTSLIFQALLPVLPQIAAAIGSVIQQVVPLVVSLTSQLIPIITSLVTAILPPLTTIFTDVVSAIGPLVAVLLEALIPAIEALLPVVVTVFSFAAELIKNVMQAIQGTIQVVTGIITGDWDKVWNGIGNIFGAVWANIQTIVASAIAIVGSLITMGMANAQRIVGGVLESIGNFFINAFRDAGNNTANFVASLVGFFAGLPGKIMGALSGAGSWLLDVGRNIVQGLINGVSGMIGRAVQAVKDVGGSMLDGIKGFLGIHSPSRVFRNEVGLMIGAGVMEGIDASQRGVSASISRLVTVPVAPAYSAGSFMPITAGAGVTASGSPIVNITQVDDPIGTATAVTRRLAALSS